MVCSFGLLRQFLSLSECILSIVPAALMDYWILFIWNYGSADFT